MGYSIRTKEFHYIEWIDRKKNQPIAIELYDNRSDPYELTNLAKKKQQQSNVKILSQLLNNGWKAALPNRR
jgi:arylsulfatase A-like enzyme